MSRAFDFQLGVASGSSGGGGGTFSFNQGSVLFGASDGSITENNPSFFWNDPNRSLSINSNVGFVSSSSSAIISLASVVQATDSERFSYGAITYNGSGGGYISLAANGTEAIPTAVIEGDVLGVNGYFGFDGTDYVPAAIIQVSAGGTVSTGVVPGTLVFGCQGATNLAVPLALSSEIAFFQNLHAVFSNSDVSIDKLTASRLVSTDVTNTLVSESFSADGQLIIGKTTGGFNKATLGAGSNINITNGVGTISIATSSTPTFTSLTLSGLNASQLVVTNGSKTLSSEAFTANGQLIIGQSGGGYSKATLTAGTNVSITNGSGSISIATSSTPTFTSLTVSGLTVTRIPYITTGGLFTTAFAPIFNSGTGDLNLSNGSLTINFVKLAVADNFTLVSNGNFGVIRPSGTSIGFNFYRGTSIVSTNKRWQLFVDSVAETGSNAGSNYRFNAYSDTGVFIDSPMQITRASGGVIFLIRPISVTGTAFISSTITSGDTIFIGSSQTGSGNYMLRMNRYTGTEAQTTGVANKISLYSSGAGNDAIIGFGVNGTSLDYVSNNAHTFYTNAVKCFVFATGVSDPIATFYAQSTIDFSLASGDGLYSKIVSTATTGSANAIKAEIRPENTTSSAARFSCLEATPILTGMAGDATSYVTGIFSQSTLPPNTFTLSNYFGAWVRLARNVSGGTVTTKVGLYVDQVSSTAGTITTAYGLKIDALTLASTNWQVAVGAGNSYFSGSTRFGSTSTPTSTVDVTGTLTVSSTATFTAIVLNGAGTASFNATTTRSTSGNAHSFVDDSSVTSGSVTNLRVGTRPHNGSASTALYASIVSSPTMSSIGANITGSGIWGIYTATDTPPTGLSVDVCGGITIPLFRTSAGTVTTMYGLFVTSGTASAGTVTTAYGVRINSITLGGTNWQLAVESGNSYFAGNTRLGGTTAPTVACDVTGALAVSTTSTFTGNVTMTAKVTTYNNVATVGNGLGSIVALSNLTTQGAAIAATTIYAVPAAGAGMYRVTWVASVTRAATSSCVLGGTNGFQVKYTDLNDSVVKTSNPTTVTVSSVNATGTTISGTFSAYCKASTNLQYLFDYTSVGATTMQYDLNIYVEYLG